MNIHANVQVKNEEVLLSAVLPIWKEYPIDRWVFYDDDSADKTSSLIRDVLGEKAFIIEGDESRYNPIKNRSMMLEHSRETGASHVVTLDADELISSNIVNEFIKMVDISSKYNVLYYTYDAVADLYHHRKDSTYENNFKNFIFPLSHAGKFTDEGMRAHSIKTPPVYLPPTFTRDAGIIHLSSISERYYALKNLLCKHRDYNEYLMSVGELNSIYDTKVNNLRLNVEATPEKITKGITFYASIFDEVAEAKGYKEYIIENSVPDLITFGKEYLI